MGEISKMVKDTMKKYVATVSGGMDSITMLYEYQNQIGLVVSFDYGGNHNQNEIRFSKLH
jgi:7-cyano-7-deazaguanine synthase